MTDMLIVDSHVHTGVNWSEPVDVLLHEMDSNGVSCAVLVGHNGNFENSYILECARNHPDRFRVVGLVDPQSADKARDLSVLHKSGASGLRINLRKHEQWDPSDPHFKLAGELGMIVSVIGHAENFASARFKALLQNCPDTHFCLEHLVRSPGKDVVDPPYDIYMRALECALWPNTSTKVPGLGEIVAKPTRLPVDYPFDTPPPHYEMAKDAFGVERMMFGSNFPVCAAKEGYRNTLEGVRNLAAFHQEGDLQWILGKTAAKIWGFDQA